MLVPLFCSEVLEAGTLEDVFHALRSGSQEQGCSQPPLLQDWLHHCPASGPGWDAHGGQQPEAAERGPGSNHAAGGGTECGGTMCHMGKAKAWEQLVATVNGGGWASQMRTHRPSPGEEVLSQNAPFVSIFLGLLRAGCTLTPYPFSVRGV